MPEACCAAYESSQADCSRSRRASRPAAAVAPKVLDGAAPQVTDPRSRDQQQSDLAANQAAFEIAVDRLEGKIKLSQNRSAEDRRGVVAALEAQMSEDSRAVAALMREIGSSES